MIFNTNLFRSISFFLNNIERYASAALYW